MGYRLWVVQFVEVVQFAEVVQFVQIVRAHLVSSQSGIRLKAQGARKKISLLLLCALRLVPCALHQSAIRNPKSAIYLLPAVRWLLPATTHCPMPFQIRNPKSQIRNPKSAIPLPINIRENVVNGSDDGDQVSDSLPHGHKRHHLDICISR